MRISRRQMIKAAGGLSAYLAAGGLFPHVVRADGTVAPRRLIQIFLQGGWDSALATDPVVGSKVTGGNYDAAYAAKTSEIVSGKANLRVGEGFLAAIPAFISVPTAFVNGMYVEVTAHELATQYMLTGQQTLTRANEPTAFIASLAEAVNAFPPHVVIGGTIPLGATRTSAPPLAAGNVVALQSFLNVPEKGLASAPGLGDIAHELTVALDRLRFGDGSASATSAAWLAAESRLLEIYHKNFGAQLAFDDAVKLRYGTSEATSNSGLIAGAFLIAKAGLSPFTTVLLPGFDTHSEPLSTQLARQTEVAGALTNLIKDLRATPDPDAPHLALSDTTTVVIMSEFVRSPTFNVISGSDHWQSASAIVMGAGVADGVVLGKTADDATALGWVDGAAVPFSAEAKIGPEHFAAAILKGLGYASLADPENAGRLDALFT